MRTIFEKQTIKVQLVPACVCAENRVKYLKGMDQNRQNNLSRHESVKNWFGDMEANSFLPPL